MPRILTILAVLMAIPAGAALAEEDCFVPMVDWQPREAVAALAVENGWTVRRIKIDDGCYEIMGIDAEGRSFEVTLHPATLQVIELEFEEMHDEDEEQSEHPSHDDGDGESGD